MWGALQGSIEYAWRRLEEYRQTLEVQVVQRFDAACTAGNHDGMRGCATVMSHFPRGAAILVNVRRCRCRCRCLSEGLATW